MRACLGGGTEWPDLGVGVRQKRTVGAEGLHSARGTVCGRDWVGLRGVQTAHVWRVVEAG